MPSSENRHETIDQALSEYAYGKQTDYGWEGVLERDGVKSGYLDTRLMLESVPNIDKEGAGKIRDLDTYLAQQLQEIINNKYEELKEAGKDEDEIFSALDEVAIDLTTELSEEELRQAIAEIISKAENGKPGSKPKIKQEYTDLENVIFQKLRQRQMGKAGPVDINKEVPKQVANKMPTDNRKWQRDEVAYVDPQTRKITMISAGSYYGLDAALSLLNNPESQLAHHVFEQVKKQNPRKKQGFSQERLQTISFRDKYSSFDRFLQQQFRNYKNKEENAPNLPEEAENEADAIRLLSEAEIEEWFVRRYEEFEQDAGVNNPNLSPQEREHRREQAETNYKAAGYDKLYFAYFPEQAPAGRRGGDLPAVIEGHPEDQGAEMGTPEDYDLHQKRWEEQERVRQAKQYIEPPSAHGLQVTPGIATWLRSRGDGSESGFQVAGELGEKVGEIDYDWSEVERGLDYVQVSFIGKVENKTTGRLDDKPVDLVFNLPKEALAAARAGERDAIEQAVQECVYKNEGSFHIQVAYDRSSGNILFGLGKKYAPEIGVPLSPESLRTIAGSRADEVVQYVDRRSSDFKSLRYEEDKQPMWDFDKYLLGQRVPKEKKILKQLVWDEAFRQVWQAKVGEQKLAELSAQVLEQSKAEPAIENRVPLGAPVDRRHPHKNRFVISSERAQSAVTSEKGQKFLGLVNGDFGDDYRNFLTSGKFWEFKQESGLEIGDAMNIVAEKALLEKGRRQDYSDFQDFASLPKDKQIEFLEQRGIDTEGQANSGLLAKRLCLFLAPAEVVNSARGYTKAEVAAKRAAIVARKQALPADYKPKPTGQTSAELNREPAESRTRINEILEKIRKRSKARIAAEPYNADDEREFEAAV